MCAVRSAVRPTGNASVACDANYAYVSSNSLATHTMMNGITATNLQVPTAQNFLGANGWKIPLAPAIATSTVSAVDGPIGIAVNGVLIFNPCKQGGCQNGDTKVLGELDVCNGHAGRADDYHYHAAPVCMMQTKAANYWDTHPVGWALDGYAIYGYNDADGKVAARDTVCGGNTNAVVNGPSGYAYHVTDASPYVLACFRGTPSPDLAEPKQQILADASAARAALQSVEHDLSDRPQRWLSSAAVHLGDQFYDQRNRFGLLFQCTGHVSHSLQATREGRISPTRSRNRVTATKRFAGRFSSPIRQARRPNRTSRIAVEHQPIFGRSAMLRFFALASVTFFMSAMVLAHELPDDRVTIVQREPTHLSITFYVDEVGLLHRLIAPKSSRSEFCSPAPRCLRRH
jgi:hypothetical protein